MTEIPTSLGFAITQTPPASRKPDLDAVARAHVHVLLLGSDIQAPVGLEWATARRNSNLVALFYKASVQQTQAAHAFLRDVAKVGMWHAFDDATDLRVQLLRHMGDHLLTYRTRYSIDDAEAGKLADWRKSLNALNAKSKRRAIDVRSGADASAIILTTERFVPSKPGSEEPG